MDRQRAQGIIEHRQQQPFGNPTGLGDQMGIGADPNALAFLSSFRSNVFSLHSAGRLTGRKIVSAIQCTFTVDGTSPTGYRIIYWNENNLEL